MQNVMETPRRRSRIRDQRFGVNYIDRSAGSERISFSAEPYIDEMTFCGRGAMSAMGLGVRSAGLRQPVRRNEGERIVPLVSNVGVRRWLGRVTVGVVALVLAIVLLVNVAGMLTVSKRVDNINRDIASQRETNTRLQEELTLERSQLNVAYEAAKLGMISSGSAEVVCLTLPETLASSLETDSLRVAE